MHRQTRDASPEGFTYEFRDVDLIDGEKKAVAARATPKKQRHRFCPAWLRDGDGIDDQGWKPFSMTTPVLLSLALLSLLIAAGIETLAQRSAARGGLALSPTQDDIPAAAMFAYQYVPNVAAAVYSLVWNWVDLDVKRMQPWFELSRPEGARGEDSLLLDYPVEFLAFVPLRAARKRHWPVFLSGTIMMLVFWVITPLQSAILGTGIAHRTSYMSVVNRSQLISPTDQSLTMNAEIIVTGYSLGWLNQTYPHFMTPEYALLPFFVDLDPAPDPSEANWTATTIKLSTELSCWPALVSKSIISNTFDFYDGGSCNASIGVTSSSGDKYIIDSVGFFGNAYGRYELRSSTCPKTPDTIHETLLIWATRTAANSTAIPVYNLTSLFCRSHYYKQEVEVTVNAKTKAPVPGSIRAVAERQPLTADEFNSTAFELLIATGQPDGAELHLDRDKPYASVVEQNPRIRDYGVAVPTSPMTGLALAGLNLSAEALADPKTLEWAFNRATKYVFSAAVSHILANTTDFSDRAAKSTYPLSGIVVSRAFSAAVEALLLTTGILTIALLWLCRKAPCHLRANPNSISRLSAIFRNSPGVVGAFRKLDNYDGKSLYDIFRHDRFRLAEVKTGDGHALCLEHSKSGEDDIKERMPTMSEPHYDPIRPFALTRTAGSMFVVLMLSALAVIIWLKSSEKLHNGLSRPSESFEVLQLLENYIPTAFATLVEPFWVLLNRLLCVMQPFQDLWVGKAKPSRTIDTTYSAIPPQLAIWRAFKAGHFVLVIVCVTTLVANLLGIGLGALFNENIVATPYSHEFRPLLIPQFSNDSITAWQKSHGYLNTGEYQDHTMLAMANLSAGTPLPPWVSPEYFFLPHELSDGRSRLATDIFTLQTRGFGANFNCTALGSRSVSAGEEKSRPPLNLTCPDPFVYAIQTMMDGVRSSWQDGSTAMQLCEPIYIDWGRPDLRCDLSYIFGWGRSNAASKANGSADISAAVCTPVLETATFNVTVDVKGNVRSYDRVTAIQSHLEFPNGDELAQQLILQANKYLRCTRQVWRNDTLAESWMPYLMTLTIGNRDFLNGNTTLPDPAAMIPSAQDVYRRTFAILLGVSQQSLFLHPEANATVTGLRITQESRIFLEKSALIITLTVLTINVLVSILFYARTTAFVLPRMPTSIGSILAYIAPSRVVAATGSGRFQRQNRTFSFGRYQGVDGLVHVGIELDPHVVPVHPKTIGASSRGTSGLWGRLRRRKNTNTATTSWL
ncbi:Spindle-body formation-associated protein [Purpureocillium lavendulum]|uniref:Spindle-body formation-associated protein n=1 Tax=Purpureocillium lavendulum TaxID=1247861 RepID=A0AB34FID2_9HYPO|nr:Spindle-body formation-associated protein [Purpureocillium lavendulum]